MRRTVSKYLLSLVLGVLCLAFAFPVFAAEINTQDTGVLAFSISSTKSGTSLKPGDTVPVTISVDASKNQTMQAYNFTLYYDSNELTVPYTEKSGNKIYNVTQGAAFTGWKSDAESDQTSVSYKYNTEESGSSGKFMLGAACTTALTHSGDFLTINLKVKDTAVNASGNVRFSVDACGQKDPSDETKIINTTTSPAIGVEDKTLADKINVAPTIKSVTLKTPPTKLSYTKGTDTSFLPAGGVITVSYSDSTSTQDFDLTAAMCSDTDVTTLGNHPVKITFEGMEATPNPAFTYTVAEKTITAATFTAPSSDQTTYLEGKTGQVLDLTGSSWEVTYSDQSTGTIATTAAMCSGYDFNKAGAQDVTVTLPGWKTTASFQITVKAKSVTAIAMNPVPTKTSYIASPKTVLDVTGGMVKVTYDNGTSKDVPLTAEMCSGYNLGTSADQTVTVTYEGQKTSFPISVKKELETVSITAPSKTTYIVNQKLDLSGSKAVLKYSDGTTETIEPLTLSSISGIEGMDNTGNLTTTGAKTATVTVTKDGVTKTDTFGLQVNDKAIASAEFTKPTSNQTKYIENKQDQVLDMTGAKWDITYDDGSKDVINNEDTLRSECSGYHFDQAGNQTVTVTLGQDKDGKIISQTFEITVQKNLVTKIDLVPAPSKGTYIKGVETSLDVSGGKLLVSYSNGSTQSIDLDSTWCDGFKSDQAGKQTITVTYTDPKDSTNQKTATFDVFVKRQISSLTWKTEATPTTFIQNDEFSTTAGVITATFSDGSTKDINVTKNMCSGLELDTNGKLISGGSQTVTVTCAQDESDEYFSGSKTITYDIRVVGFEKNTLTQPNTTKYNVGTAFDGTGITATFYNSNGEAVKIAWGDENLKVEGYDANKVGEQLLTLVYTDAQGNKFELKDAIKVTVVVPDVYYEITASAGENGTITPNDVVSVKKGDSQTFTITPNSGYVIDDVLVDNASVKSKLVDNTYTFDNVGGNHSISATFKLGVISVSYRTYNQNKVWADWTKDGITNGSTGQSIRLDQFQASIKDMDGLGVTYQAHIQNIGWQNWVKDGASAGEEGKRLEGISMKLTGDKADQYDIYYRVHVQNYGWMDWASNGEQAGTTGYGYRLEAVQVVVILKGQAAPAPTPANNTSKHFSKAENISFVVHGQDYGWTQGWMTSNQLTVGTAGVTGQGLRLEAIKIKDSNANINLSYQVHVQNLGWLKKVSEGQMAGTTGWGLQMEAIKIWADGSEAANHTIQYRVYVKNNGWTKWVNAGETAGTTGQGLRLEAIQIRVAD